MELVQNFTDLVIFKYSYHLHFMRLYTFNVFDVTKPVVVMASKMVKVLQKSTSIINEIYL